MFGFPKKKQECPPPAPGTVRRHYLVYGRVQNVGFRYRAMVAAQGLELTGWVANLEDGSVEMEVQGPPEQIDRLIPAITEDSHICVTDLRCRELPVNPREKRFAVRN